jgi:uncharacterized protein (DUF849 family)
VHFHAYDVETGKQTTDFDIVERILDQIRSKVDAIVYPAIRYISNEQAISKNAGFLKYQHLTELAERGLLEWLIVDPGSTNLITFGQGEGGHPGFVDVNSPASIRHGLALASKHSLHPTFAIYEPGYLRLAELLSRTVQGVLTPIYRFMFSEDLTFGFPPEPFALQAYVELLQRMVPNAVWMIAGLGVDVSRLYEQTIAAGGDVRVGLEDAPLGCRTTNRHLVEQAAKSIVAAGSRVPSTSEVRNALKDARTASRPLHSAVKST